MNLIVQDRWHWEGRRKKNNVQTWKKAKRLAWTIKSMLEGILCNTIFIVGDLTIVSALKEHTQGYRIRTLIHKKSEPYLRRANQSISRVDAGTLPDEVIQTKEWRLTGFAWKELIDFIYLTIGEYRLQSLRSIWKTNIWPKKPREREK